MTGAGAGGIHGEMVRICGWAPLAADAFVLAEVDVTGPVPAAWAAAMRAGSAARTSAAGSERRANRGEEEGTLNGAEIRRTGRPADGHEDDVPPSAAGTGRLESWGVWASVWRLR